ncbi:MAG: hypothetical protein IT306_30400 [Chloroflexi bacterium]|nr:hypothetical protein [Chloroflexota bacterium]
MADERRRLHELVDQLPGEELALAAQLLELLVHGRGGRGVALTNGHDDDEEPEAVDASAETVARLAQLTDEDLLRLDELLESDPEGARQFWRERFGEELPADDLMQDDDEDVDDDDHVPERADGR